jgi:hypothetical protein
MMEDASDIAYHMPFLEECASRAGVIVEIGVGHGNGSTRAFGRGLSRSDKQHKMHVLVDTDPERPQEKPPYDYWKVVTGASESEETMDAVDTLIQNHYADIIFIDTVHTYEQMKPEMCLWTELQWSGTRTLWLYHDTWMFGVYNHMTEAIKEFAVDGWEYVDHSKLAHGMGVLRHKGGPWGWIEPRVESAPVPEV